MAESVSVTCSGSFELAIDARRAIELFTPEGERTWVAGWEPRYPDQEADRRAVGTAFTTRGEHGELLWVITGTGELAMSYARFDPRGIVTAIEVGCAPLSELDTRVDVSYRMTAVHEGARAEIADFAAGYDAYLGAWKRAIDAAL